MPAPKWLFEFEDFDWFPDTIRESMTDFLRYLLRFTDFYAPIVPIIREGLQHANTNAIVDLCSGSGGPAMEILSAFKSQGTDVCITLTDKFPNKNAWQLLQQQNTNITYIETPTDATAVPAGLKGFRTMFSAVHHLEPQTISQILKNTAEDHCGIGIFDGGDKNLLTVLGIILVHPLLFFFATPFFRPLRASRFLFTYLIPVIPFCTIWDGAVSILRLYRPEELLAIAQNTGIQNYHWHAGSEKNKFGMRVTYLIGYPQTPNDATQGLS